MLHYDRIKPLVSRQLFESRPNNMWRWKEFLPLNGEPTVGLHVGGTPLVKADRLGKAIGIENLWVKNDAVNFPTLSFKDRVVAVALSKAREFGLETVGCASTGNLANSVAANAAAAGLKSYILVPSDLERAKVLGTSVYGANVISVRGTYDEVNRLCTQIAFHHGKRPDALKRCLRIIEDYDPKSPNQLPLILKAKGLYEEFCVEG